MGAPIGPDEGAPIGPVDAMEVPRFAGVRTFARLPLVTDVERVDIAVLGAPFDGGTTFRAGARFGPAAVREASVLLRPYNPDLGIAPFEAAQVADAGDAPCNPVDIEAAHAAIEESAAELIAGGAVVVGIGGDHSVSLPLLRAAAAAHGPLALVQLDAHSDTWDSYFGCKLTHGTVFRRAIEAGAVDPGRSVQIGLRGSLYGAGDEEENRGLGPRLVGADLVEVSPPYDPAGVTALAGANVVYQLVSMVAAGRRSSPGAASSV